MVNLMKRLQVADLRKAHGTFTDEEQHKYDVIEVESGFIYHSHAFNTSTFVPHKQKPTDITLESLITLFETWDPMTIDPITMYQQIEGLISRNSK